MKNFHNFYKKVDAIANEKKAKNKAASTAGLLSRSKDAMDKKQTSDDVYSKVAEYIKAIRKQKEEILNGKS
jgi:hypothetical protein